MSKFIVPLCQCLDDRIAAQEVGEGLAEGEEAGALHAQRGRQITGQLHSSQY